MNKEEAITHLEEVKSALDNVFSFTAEEKAEAIDLAIKALKKPAGHWIIRKGEPDILATTGKRIECSECGFVTAYGSPRYCFNCGAKMEKGADE